MKKPKISIFCPAYNHEKYVLDLLNSLLAQTCPDWELIIIDDCSTDQTAEKIKSVHDKRIRFIQNEFNRGPQYSIMKAYELASSEIVAGTASDDMLCPEYVETVLKAFDENKDIVACYSPLACIDENGHITGKVYSLPYSKSEQQIFYDMFLGANGLPSPGLAYKKSVFMPDCPLNAGLLQYQDYQIQFPLLYRHKIKMLDKPVALYRKVHDSASKRSHGLIVREDVETDILMNTVVKLIGDDKDAFLEYFGGHPLLQNIKVDAKTIPFWLGRVALTSPDPVKQKWGLKIIMNFISTDENMRLLHRLYGFSFKDYIALANEVDQKQLTAVYWSKKYQKTIKKLKYVACLLGLALIICFGYIIFR